jgi:hypothetical protein
LDSDELLQIIELQKSRWSAKYYINVGYWLKEFGPARTPAFSDAHVLTRASSQLDRPNARVFEESVLDLEDVSIGESERVSRLEHYVQEFLYPFLRSTSRIEGLRAEYRKARDMLVAKEAHSLIGVPESQS